MDFDSYISDCLSSSGGGTGQCVPTDTACVANAAAAVNACQAGWTSVPGNCHEEGTQVSQSGGVVTETTPSGQIATATANTAPATAYGAGISQTGAPLSSYVDTGLPGAPVVISSSAPPSSPTPSTVVASSSAPPSTPAASVISSSAPPTTSSTASTSTAAPASSDVVMGGLDLSTLPWYVWAGVAAVALFAFTRK